MKSDFLVIGSGIAGLTFALKAAERGDVTIITKSKAYASNTRIAQGGIACVTADEDSFGGHVKDTLIAGAGLSDPMIVSLMVSNAPECIKDLERYGVNFTRKEQKFDLGREGGHSSNRIVHVHDYTGADIERILLKRARLHPRIQILEHHYAVELISENDCCFGSVVYSVEDNRTFPVYAYHTVLSTGGAGQLFSTTTNSPVATGDGIALAARAGAAMSNLEFIQFHPTAFYEEKHSLFLISEALRGFGAVLKLKNGSTFMNKYHPLASLAPRDVVSRAIAEELRKSGEKFVYLDATHIDRDRLKEHFPMIYSKCMEKGVDITKVAIPVIPAAHYLCGGILVNINGCTTIENLYAVGEVASTGVHGANRLASNSLLEAWFFANRAFEYIDEHFELDTYIQFPKANQVNHPSKPAEKLKIKMLKNAIRQIMSKSCGIIRNSYTLSDACFKIEELLNECEVLYSEHEISRETITLRNMARASSLILLSAYSRRESRGGHYMEDFPMPRMEYMHDTVV